MARHFEFTSTQYLQAMDVPISAHPFSMSLWIRPTGTDYVCVSLATSTDSDQDYFFLQCSTSYSTRARIDNGGVNATAYGSADAALNTWSQLGARFISNTSRYCYHNGTSGAENTVNVAFPSGLDNTSIGVLGDNGPTYKSTGDIAEFAIWDGDITPDDMTRLALGYSPLLIRPDSLVRYWPLVREGDRDLVGGVELTAYNTPTVAVHTRVMYATPLFRRQTEGLAPLSVAVTPTNPIYVRKGIRIY